MQYIYRRYGRERAGIAATVIHYRPRSAIREVGKALGLTEDVTARWPSTIWGSWGRPAERTGGWQARLRPAIPKSPAQRFGDRLLFRATCPSMSAASC
jgi:error-prone DNA polymerase